jgi:membrane protease YdiL (CAAX protease family)
MKKIFNRFPFFARVVFAFLLGCAAIIASHFIYSGLAVLKIYFPFVAEVLLIIVTAMLYHTDGQNLSALGLNPSPRNIGFLFLGLVIGILALAVAGFLRSIYTGEQWHVHTTINTIGLLKSLYYILPTVTVQELIFRGYLFTKTISLLGLVKANIIFAFLFMLVHVLDRDVLQNSARIIMLAIAIPVGHLLFATALVRTKTILFSIGLHWGNNWAVNHLSGTDNNLAILYTTHQKIYTTWPPFLILLLIFNGFFLLLSLAIWKWGKISRFQKPLSN